MSDARASHSPGSPSLVSPSLVSKGRTFIYGFGLLPIAALALPLSILLPPLYAETFGLGVATVGLVFTLARLWDFVTDLAMGWAIDRFPSRWGRRKHWVVLSLPLLMLGGWQLYLPPAFSSHWAGVLHLSIWLFVLYVGFTLLLITHYAWGAELTSSTGERAKLYGARDMFLIGGILLCLIGPAVVEGLYGASQAAQVGMVGLFLLVLLPVAVGLLVWRLPDDARAPAPRAPFRRGFALARDDALFRMPLYLDFLTGLGQGVTAAVFVFAATHAYALPGRSSLLLLGYFVAGLAAMPLWIWAARRFGAERAYSWACLWIALVALGYLAVPPGSLVLLAVVVVANGLAIGPPFFVTRTLMADAIDRSERDGVAIRSLGFAMLNMSNKISGALAVGIAFACLALFGFDTGSEGADVDDTARTGLRLVFGIGPALCYGAAFLVLRRMMTLQRAERTEL